MGRQIGATAGGAVKRVALELGGKSANVILPGADLAKAVNVGIANVMTNSGQTCSAWTRMLVDAERYEEAVELAAQAVLKYAPGERVGPLVNAKQQARVLGYIRKGMDEGARLIAGGPDAPLETGYYVKPHRLRRCHPGHDHRPGGDLRPGGLDPAVRGRWTTPSVSPTTTVYGLAGSRVGGRRRGGGRLRPPDGHRAGRHQRRPVQPAGPLRQVYKQSGVGRELGPHGLAEYLQTKSLQF
ncbi:Aldehyde dehydrogenase OS=Streptomyces microflavus OX=1919 GN=Smic_13660 PE=3 SV=1 [Streptomyces microflavus]